MSVVGVVPVSAVSVSSVLVRPVSVVSVSVDAVGVSVEVDSVEDARRYTDDFPLTKAGLLEWVFVPLTAPLPVESLFRAEVDVDEPYDRTFVATTSREAA